MRLELNDDALEFGRVVRDALGAAGGDELIQRAETETEPGTGEALVADTLAPLGVWDLDVGAQHDLEAAAAACRAAGWWAAPGAVAHRLARPRDLASDALCVIAAPRPAAPVHASELTWTAVDLDGRRFAVTPSALGPTARQTANVADLGLEPIDEAGTRDAVVGLVLPCWTLLGMLDRAVALTAAYVREREQFGKPLAAFQAVQFQLTEAEVERAGMEVLAAYALWSLGHDQPDALADALALRLAAIDAADSVFRICHQLHGAFGFCDEATISWLSRYSQPIRRLPLPRSGTRTALARHAGARGLTGLYSRV